MSIPSSIVTAEQNFLKRVPKLRTENGVDDRIERRIEIAQPENDRHHVFFEQLRTDGHYHSHYEERQPAEHESACDDGEGFGRFSFTLGIHTVAGFSFHRVMLWLVSHTGITRGRR